jgi:Sec-independent protein secretion pathway component TatC
MKFIRSLVFVCGILFVCFTVLPAVIGFLIPVLGGLMIVAIVIGCAWFTLRIVFKGGGN